MTQLRLILSALFSFTYVATFAWQPTDAILVGNNKGGTVSIIDSRTLEVIKTIDVAPDRNEPRKQGLLNRYVNRKLGPKYVDDIDVLPDGRTMIISRPFFADISAFDLSTGSMIWSLFLKKRPDHQVMTSDGKYLFVSLLAAAAQYRSQ